MKKIIIVIVALVLTGSIYATGVILPSNENYPEDLLRNSICEITVDINKNYAETTVYEEFINESSMAVNGVYSFPLPEDARSIALYYWRNDSLFQAVLKVQPQEPNPGTGTGGIAAEVNDYIGKNGLRIKFLQIPAGGVQKVELHYISKLQFFNNRFTYTYPLNTSRFIDYPEEYLKIDVNVKSDSLIESYSLPGFDGYSELYKSGDSLHVNYTKSKFYLSKDFQFEYEVANAGMSIQFETQYYPSESKGHYSLFYNTPPVDANYSQVPNRVVFVLETSNRVYGANFSNMIDAMKEAVLLLNAGDSFNIVGFDNSSHLWQTSPVEVTADNINSATTFLEGLTPGYGGNLQNVLLETLPQLNDTLYNNSMIVFSTGYSPVNPEVIEANNTNNTGIVTFGISKDVERARLEMLSATNHGVTYYFNEENYNRNFIRNEITKVLRPIAKNIKLAVTKDDITEVLPLSSPHLYGGSNFLTSGQFTNTSESSFTLFGTNDEGNYVFETSLDFTADSSANKLADKFWAKSKIDYLEWVISVNGETAELKSEMIDISLKYNIRCRYTAYIADYEDLVSGIEDKEETIPADFSIIAANYPNPFNPSTKIRFFIANSDLSKVKLLKIYNVLGELVYVIDISGFNQGWHELSFMGRDLSGNQLPSGIYIASLQVGNKIVYSVKMIMLK